jgi:hypothetical protein
MGVHGVVPTDGKGVSYNRYPPDPGTNNWNGNLFPFRSLPEVKIGVTFRRFHLPFILHEEGRMLNQPPRGEETNMQSESAARSILRAGCSPDR